MESNSLTTRLCAALAVFVLVFGMLVPASAEEMTSQQGSVEGTSQTVAGQQEDPKPNEGLGTSKQEAQKAKEAAPSDNVDGTSVQDNANKQGSSPQSGEALATMEEAAEQGTDAKAEVLAEETSEVLTEDKGAAEQVVAAEATNGASISYEAHVQRKGWMPAVGDGATCGTTGQALRLEAVRIQAPGVNATVVAQAHVQRKGWMGAVKSGGVCGTVGSALRMEAIKLWLEGPDAQKYDIEYRAHVQSIGWTPWCRNGRVAGTTGRALRQEPNRWPCAPRQCRCELCARAARLRAARAAPLPTCSNVPTGSWWETHARRECTSRSMAMYPTTCLPATQGETSGRLR